MVTINGKKISGYDEVSIDEMLAGEGFNKTQIAVEVNELIILKKDYDKTLLHDGDIVEVVNFVGGGQFTGKEGKKCKIKKTN